MFWQTARVRLVVNSLDHANQPACIKFVHSLKGHHTFRSAGGRAGAVCGAAGAGTHATHKQYSPAAIWNVVMPAKARHPWAEAEAGCDGGGTLPLHAHPQAVGLG